MTNYCDSATKGRYRIVYDGKSGSRPAAGPVAHDDHPVTEVGATAVLDSLSRHI